MTDATARGAARPAVDVAVEGIGKRFDAAPVLSEVSVSVGAGCMLALLGPSGCGKTTLLRIVAGLERADRGRVRLGDRVVADPAAGVDVAPERRAVGMVFQDWALFPHLSVARNVGFGLPRAERKRSPRIDAALAMVGLSGLGDRMPGTLSGGQQQRVALARALAPEPGVLLLDEPFSNLDTSLRVQVRTEVHQLLAELGITTVFVTHDQDEAFVLGDEVAVMSQGRVVQQASPAQLYRRPATTWVSTFVGEANLLDGHVDAAGVHTSLGHVPVDPETMPPTVGSGVSALVRPEHVVVESLDTGGVPARVELVEFYGHDTVYVVTVEGAEPLRARVGAAPRFARGDTVSVRYVGPPTVLYGPDGTLLEPPGPVVATA